MAEAVTPSLRLADLRRAAVPLPVDFGGQTVTLQYRPYALDAAWEDAFLAALEGADSQFAVYAVYRQLLPDILAGWNLTDDAGAPLPLDAATLRALPGAALVAWYRAIQEHLRPN